MKTKKKMYIAWICLVFLLAGAPTGAFAAEGTDSSQTVRTDAAEQEAVSHYTAAPSAEGAVDQYMTSVENKVKNYLYENRTINHRVVPVEVPILMFHHLSEEKGATLTPESFRRYMIELAENGYHTISYDELYAFVREGGTLPEKPIIISLDDGYLSNYEYAYPILKQLGMKGEISVVGSTMGRDTHPETGNPIIPHFTWEQAKEMIDSGVIKIHSHSYDMHQHASAEDVSRLGVIRNQYESDSLYSTLFSGDGKYMKELIRKELGYDDPVFTYPYGKLNAASEQILTNLKYKITVSTETGTNYIRIGDTGSLRGMKRIACDTNDSESIIARIKYYSQER